MPQKSLWELVETSSKQQLNQRGPVSGGLLTVTQLPPPQFSLVFTKGVGLKGIARPQAPGNRFNLNNNSKPSRAQLHANETKPLSSPQLSDSSVWVGIVVAWQQAHARTRQKLREARERDRRVEEWVSRGATSFRKWNGRLIIVFVLITRRAYEHDRIGGTEDREDGNTRPQSKRNGWVRRRRQRRDNCVKVDGTRRNK